MKSNPSQEISPTEPSQEMPEGMSASSVAEKEKHNSDQKAIVISIVLVLIALLAASVTGVWFLAQADINEVARIRDIFIIFLAIQSLFTGIALVILLIQLAQLINLLKNEVKPILESTNQTVSTLRGTTNFLSNNLVEPVIKLNEYMAGLSTFLQSVGLIKRNSKKTTPKGD